MNKKRLFRISALISGFSGLTILLGVILPIVKYEIDSKQKYPVLIIPIGISSGSSVLGINYKDSNKASNWFEGNLQNRDFNSQNVFYYSLSIPKLKIENASVLIGGEDLSKNLIHYPGTALPGKIGNSVIFGHSVLPIFFNPKSYTTIFSTLPTLNKGDIIEVNYDGVFYRYEVETKYEVLPTDTQVLDQDKDDSFLTLVTCVPPGDLRKPKRLVVRARIVAPSQNYESSRR